MTSKTLITNDRFEANDQFSGLKADISSLRCPILKILSLRI